MPIGTEGPDVFEVNNHDAVYGMGGDDVVNVPSDLAHGTDATPRSVWLDGGAGFDTLNITASYLQALAYGFGSYNGEIVPWGFAILDGLTVRHVGTDVNFFNFERLYVSSTAYLGSATSGGWSTGDTIDEIHVNGTSNGGRMNVFTGGGDDKIYLSGVGAGSTGHGGSGNDLVDLSGAGPASAFGDEGNDTLVGSSQADMLDGGSGVDSMSGGGGDDIYIVDNSNDTIVEAGDGGLDTARVSAAAYVLAAGVENLVAIGSGPHNFTLNAGDNVVTGAGGADFLRLHLGGDDTASGLGGNDVFYFGGALDSGDLVNGGAGAEDTLVLQGNYSSGLVLAANVVGVESISMLAGSNTAFGEPGTNRYDYVIVVSDTIFAPGVRARINGSSLLAGEDFTFIGAAETNASFVIYGGKGTDRLLGGVGNDIFFFAEDGRFGSGEFVDGGLGYDGLFLRGNYTLDLNVRDPGALLLNLENLTLSSASDERYARGGGSEFDYDITWANALLGPGQTITINGALLQANETMVFRGASELDGSFRIFAGAGTDSLSGGLGADLIAGGLGGDTLRGGGGNDVFRYDNILDSGAGAADRIEDFAAGDKVDLSRIDAHSGLAGNQAFSFIGGAAFGRHAGELRFENVAGNNWRVQGDTDGDGDSDFELLLVAGANPVAADFIL